MLNLLTKGEGGVGEMLTVDDKGGRRGLGPPFLADIICEQPLIAVVIKRPSVLWAQIERDTQTLQLNTLPANRQVEYSKILICYLLWLRLKDAFFGKQI